MSFLGGNSAIPHPGYGAPSLPRTDATFNVLDRYNTTDSYTFLNPYEKMSNTHYNAQQAYGLSAYQVRTIIAGQIKKNQEESWYTSIALPRVETRNNRVSWHTIIFENALAELTPVEGVPRIVSSSMHSDTRTLHRRAIALLSEESFRNTPNGSTMYLMSLKHLATVVSDTQNYDVIMAYFNCERYDLQWARNHNYYNKKTINDIFKRDVDSFAAIQKFGFAKMDADISSIHTLYGGEGFDMWILPREARVFLGLVPEENKSYWKGGEQAVNQLKDGIGRVYDDAGSALIFGNVYKIFFTRTYAIGNGSELLNPMLRQRVVGEYFPQVSEPNQSGLNYSSNHRIIKIYDEDLDDNVIISLQDSLEGIKYMFDDSTGKIKSLNELAPAKKYDIIKFNEHMLQHFLYRGIGSNTSGGGGNNNNTGRSYKNAYSSEESPDPISVFGEMKQDHFTTRSTFEMSKSLLKSIISQIDCVCSCEELYSDFTNGIEFIESCMNENISSYIDALPQSFSAKDNYTIEYQEPDDRYISSDSVPILPFDGITGSSVIRQLLNLRSSKNKFIDPENIDIDTLLTESQKQKLIILPYLTNWTGLYYLSEHGKELQKLISETTFNTINKFVNVVKKIVLNMKHILKDCPLLDKKYTLPYYPIQSEESVFLSHLPQFQNVYPLWTDRNYADFINDNYKQLNDLYKLPKESTKPGSGSSTPPSDVSNNKIEHTLMSIVVKSLSNVCDNGDHIYSTYLKLLSTIMSYTRLAFSELLTDTKKPSLTIKYIDDKDNNNKLEINMDKVSKNVQILLYSIALLRNIFGIRTIQLDNDTDVNNIITYVDDKLGYNFYDSMELVILYPETPEQPDYRNFFKMTNENQKLLLQTLYELFNSHNDDEDSEKIKIFKDFVKKFSDYGGVVRRSTSKILSEWISTHMDVSAKNDLDTLYESNLKNEAITTTEFNDILDNINGKYGSKIKPSKKITIDPVRTTFIINRERLYDLFSYIKENYPSVKDNSVPPITVSLPNTQYNKPATLKEIEEHINISNSRMPAKSIYKRQITKPKYLDEKVMTNVFSYLNGIVKQKSTINYLFEMFKNEVANYKDDDILFSVFYYVNAQKNPDSNIIIQQIIDFIRTTPSVMPNVKKVTSYFNEYDINNLPTRQKPISPPSKTLRKASTKIKHTPKYSSDSFTEYGHGLYEDSPGDEYDDTGILEKMTTPIDRDKYNKRQKQMEKKFNEYQTLNEGPKYTQFGSIYSNNTVNFEDIANYVMAQNYDSFGSNPVLEENLELIRKDKNVGDLEKLISIAILLTPIEYSTLRTIIDRNILLPMNFLHMRPYMRYQTLSGIKARAGSDTGNTFVNVEQDNVMEGTSVETKTHLRHVSYVSASVITNNRFVFVAYDIFCFKCLGGAGTKFYTMEDVQNDYSLAEHRYPMEKSIIVAPIPYEERNFPNPLDASGTFSYFSTQGFTNGKEQPLHYSTAALMNAIFGFRGLSDTSVQDIEIWNYHPRSDGQYTTNVNPKNTIMFSGLHEIFDSRTKKYVIKQGTGHFKSYAGPGCQSARNGGLVKWKMPKNIFQ